MGRPVRRLLSRSAPGGFDQGNVTQAGRPARFRTGSGPALRESTTRPIPRMTPMPDPRWESLANLLIDHSLQPAADETLLIECFDLPDLTLPRAAGPEGRRTRGPSPGRDAREPDPPRARETRLGGVDADLGRDRPASHGARAGLSRPPGRLEHQRDDRRPAREDGPVQHPLPEAGPLRVADHARPAGASSACPARAWPSRPG